MKRSLFWLSSILVLTFTFSAVSICQGKTQEHKSYRVVHVIDGDTIILDNKEHVRMIGIDAPEIKKDAKFNKDVVERNLTSAAELAMGHSSYKFTKKLLEGKKVHLEFDKDKYDEYHRLLAYVYLANGDFANAQIVKAGYAYAYPVKPDLRYAQLFRKLYKESREAHRGLWKDEKDSKNRLKWFNKT